MALFDAPSLFPSARAVSLGRKASDNPDSPLQCRAASCKCKSPLKTPIQLPPNPSSLTSSSNISTEKKRDMSQRIDIDIAPLRKDHLNGVMGKDGIPSSRIIPFMDWNNIPHHENHYY
jgi:hypothetical protein